MKTLNLKSKTIVLVHGLFVNNLSWEAWKAFFEAKGYTVYNPANPSHSGNPADLRTNIDPNLTKVNFVDVVENLVKFIDALPEKPILIGHSLGGLTVQKLMDLGKGEAGVMIDGAPPMGVIPYEFSFWKSNFRVVNPFKGNSVFMPTKKWFHYTFGNTLSRAESDQVFDEIAVPESRAIAWGTLKSYAKIDFKKAHQPLLFIAGEKDNIMPASLNRRNFNAYKNVDSITDFKMFEGRGHYICGEKNWEEVATYVYDWISK